MKLNYSVLMSVYRKERPDYLRESMDSIARQTVPADDFVLVCDGPLTPGLDAVIAEEQRQFGDVLQVVRLPKNGGLGNALNQGMKYCKNELVARMDSDDISYPDRCERQLAVFAAHPEYAVVSGIVEEFDGSPDHITARRVVPETQQEILKFAKARNPFNHPGVMYRKSAVEAAGGYQDFYLLEDYYLWLRMLKQGFMGYNIQSPILWMRAGKGMYKRRGGWKYAVSQKRLLDYMLHEHMISGVTYCAVLLIRMGAAMMPNWLREGVFKTMLRDTNRNSGGGISNSVHPSIAPVQWGILYA